MFSFRYTSGVCKQTFGDDTVAQDGSKNKLETLIHVHQLLMDFTDSFTIRPSKQYATKIYDVSHQPETCGYTTFQNNTLCLKKGPNFETV